MRRTSVLWAFLILAAAPIDGRASDEQWQVGTMPSFSSGTYGTDSRTSVLHTPISARRLFANGDLTLVFPFMCVTGNGAFTIVGNSPVPADPVRVGGASTDSGATRSGTTTGSRTESRTTTTEASGTVESSVGQSATSCGRGDVVVRGRYYVVDERAWWPTIALRGHLKVPTADADQGLGTGRVDEGMGVEVTRTFRGGFMAMADAGYTVMGEPAGVTFNNNWWYDVGIGQDIARGVVNVSVFFEHYSAVVPGYPDARDVLAAITVKGAGGWQIQAAGEFGVSDGAPDHGFTLGASRRF